jgi:hypothetical protein
MSANTGSQQPLPKSSVGHSWASKKVIVIMAIYLALLTLAIIVCIIQIWPPQTTDTATTINLSLLFWTNVTMTSEAHLVLLVVLAAALGAQAFVIRSFFWYVGQHMLRNSWLLRYLFMPFAGIAAALAFYFVIRGGFLSSESTTANLSPVGFVAMGILVGMFTDPAVIKLKTVAEAFFEKKEEGDDPASDKTSASSTTTQVK